MDINTKARCDPESEEIILSMILIDPSIISEVQLIIKSDMFSVSTYRKIYETMCDLSNQSLIPDYVSITKTLQDKGEFKSGSEDFKRLVSLRDDVSTSYNFKQYAENIKNCWQKRELADIASVILEKTKNFLVKGDEIMSELEKRIIELSMNNSQYKIYNGADMANAIGESIRIRSKNKSGISGVTSGFPTLDEMTNGFQKGDLVIVGARPSIGKTALALSMIEHIAIDQQVSCGFFSAEMSLSAISDRVLSLTSKIALSKVRKGDINFNNKYEDGVMNTAMSKIYSSTVHVCDAPNIKISALRSIARRMKFEHKVKVIFVDYMGLVDAEFQGSEYEKTSFVSKSLKGIARELEVPVVALCQLNRDAEGNVPTLAQLRGSGSIEQDADLVIFLHRDRSYNEGDTEVDTQMIVAKQRQGATGVVEIKFKPMTTEYIEKKKGENDEAKCPF